MKKFGLTAATCLAFALIAACRSTTTRPSVDSAKLEKAKASSPFEPKLSEAKPPTFSPNSSPDTSAAVRFPFPDFPKVATTAKGGDYVLAPSYNWIKDAADKGAETTTFIWYVQKMSQPDKDNSELQFLSERRKVPNAYIIAIPPRQSAKKGDVVLTWWQTGSGMQRAIVVDDTEPIRPIVRYLDIAFDNPAKARDGVTTIGKMDEKIVPDSFVRLKNWDPGTTVAVQQGANQRYARIIRVVGNQVLVLEGSNLKIYPKANCQSLPLVPTVSPGERVRASRYGQNFVAASVLSVDGRNGRVFVKFDGDRENRAIAFGDVWKY
jgi:hypothetical protein